MIDDDNNYYEVSNEKFARIEKTGEPIFDAPIFMQKVKMPATNPNFIMVGFVGYRSDNQTKAIFMRRTKELENGANQAFENFSKAIAPLILNDYFMCQQAAENIERIKNKCQREIEQVEKEYNRNIEFAKKYIENKEKL